MKRFALAAAVAAVVGGSAVAGNIVIPEDGTPFVVEQGDVVRIPVKGIAGTAVAARVEGPAKQTVNTVVFRVKGRAPVGAGNHEVDVLTTGRGMVVVEVTVRPPNGPAKAHKFEFEVK